MITADDRWAAASAAATDAAIWPAMAASDAAALDPAALALAWPARPFVPRPREPGAVQNTVPATSARIKGGKVVTRITAPVAARTPFRRSSRRPKGPRCKSKPRLVRQKIAARAIRISPVSGPKKRPSMMSSPPKTGHALAHVVSRSRPDPRHPPPSVRGRSILRRASAWAPSIQPTLGCVNHQSRESTISTPAASATGASASGFSTRTRALSTRSSSRQARARCSAKVSISLM